MFVSGKGGSGALDLIFNLRVGERVKRLDQLAGGGIDAGDGHGFLSLLENWRLDEHKEETCELAILLGPLDGSTARCTWKRKRKSGPELSSGPRRVAAV
jgi:hypothetical protein